MLPSTPTTYGVSFDYRFNIDDVFKVKFTQDTDDPNYPKSFTITKDGKNHNWQHWENAINTTPGATNAVFELLPELTEKCEVKMLIFKSCIKTTGNFEVNIRNLKVEKIDYPTLYLTRLGTGESNISDTQVSWRKVNPTKYELEINKANNKKELLVFSELFDPNWVLDTKNEEKFNSEHVLVNIYANGWLIDKSGKYKVEIIYKPQDTYIKSVYLAVISICITLAILYFGRKKHENK